METMIQDIRYGLRMLLRKPGLTAAAVLSLALGIGANTTIFTWVKSVLLDPFPGVSHSDGLVILGGRSKSGNYSGLSYPDYRDFREKSNDVLSGVVVQDDAIMSLSTGSGADRPERLWGAVVSGDYFDLLGVRTVLGRGFMPEEDRTAGTHAVAVISYDVWQRRFAGDPAVAGRNVTINGQPFTIVGVTPKAFIGTFMGLATDVWVPIMMEAKISQRPSRLEARGDRWLQSLAVLKPGAGKSQVQAAVSTIAAGLAQAYPESNEGRTLIVYSLWDSPWGAASVLRPVLMVLSGVTALVLLISCANVANLLLARAVGRRREVAMRLSLGASRTRLLRQLLTESIVLSLMGGAGGIVIAYWTSGTLMAFIPPTDAPIKLMLGVDTPTVLFALAISLVTGIVFGLAPALQTSKANILGSLKDASGSSGGRGRSRLRGSLVIAQVAVSSVLLICAGLFLQSLKKAQTLDPGFAARQVLMTSYDLSALGYAREQGVNFHRQLLARAGSLPDVRSVSFARRVPLGLNGSSSTSFAVEGYQAAPDEELFAEYNVVGPDYFKTLQIPVLLGRDFSLRDSTEVPSVVVINETMAKRYWKDREALGDHIRIGDTTREVIAIVKDGKYHSLAEEPMPYFYLPLLQSYAAGIQLLVATEGDPASVLPAVRQEVRAMDPNLALFEIKTMGEHLQIASFIQRIAATLLSAMGALALLLATVGLYGVIAYAVSQRTKEVGIRMALGAGRGHILQMVVRQGMVLALIGVGLGLALAVVGTRFLSSLLQGVSATDPMVFVTVPLLLGTVAFVASYIPARRATRTDPMIALRYE